MPTITRHVFERAGIITDSTISRMAMALFNAVPDLERCVILTDEQPNSFEIVTPYYTVPDGVKYAVTATAPSYAKIEYSGRIDV